MTVSTEELLSKKELLTIKIKLPKVIRRRSLAPSQSIYKSVHRIGQETKIKETFQTKDGESQPLDHKKVLSELYMPQQRYAAKVIHDHPGSIKQGAQTIPSSNSKATSEPADRSHQFQDDYLFYYLLHLSFTYKYYLFPIKKFLIN